MKYYYFDLKAWKQNFFNLLFYNTILSACYEKEEMTQQQYNTG